MDVEPFDAITNRWICDEHRKIVLKSGVTPPKTLFGVRVYSSPTYFGGHYSNTALPKSQRGVYAARGRRTAMQYEGNNCLTTTVYL